MAKKGPNEELYDLIRQQQQANRSVRDANQAQSWQSQNYYSQQSQSQYIPQQPYRSIYQPPEPQKKKKKPIFKRWWFWAAVAVIALAGIFYTPSDTDSGASPVEEAAAPVEATPSPSARPSNTPIVVRDVPAHDMIDRIKDRGSEDSANAENTSANAETESESTDTSVGTSGNTGISKPKSGSGKGTVGDYYVELKSYQLTTDYEGNRAIVITYTWTNNSDETTSAAIALIGKAFQDGIQLDPAMILNSKVYDSGASFKEIRPGTSLDVQHAYKLISNTPEIEYEITEFLGWNDDMVSATFRTS